LTPLLRITQEVETGVRSKQKQEYDEQRRVAAVIQGAPQYRTHSRVQTSVVGYKDVALRQTVGW
jgi:hypothetical protein